MAFNLSVAVQFDSFLTFSNKLIYELFIIFVFFFGYKKKPSDIITHWTTTSFFEFVVFQKLNGFFYNTPLLKMALNYELKINFNNPSDQSLKVRT